MLFLFSGFALGQLPGIKQALEDTRLQKAHQIGLALFAYSNDNNQAYPDGKSSTEIFQKLMDGNYITDPGVFFIPLPGKTQAVGGQKLKPENVCFDVTCCVDSSAPDSLPMVFLTGYKVTYAAGAAAVPLAKPYPVGIAVCFKGANTKFMIPGGNTDGSISNFVPPNFDPQGKTYRQLTPGGSLPP